GPRASRSGGGALQDRGICAHVTAPLAVTPKFCHGGHTCRSTTTTGVAMPLFHYTRAGGHPRGIRGHSPLPWLALIALILALVAFAFAWLAGWIGRDRLTAQSFTDAIEAIGGKHPGFRRAHSKGVCVSGWFEPSTQAATLSRARVFE